MADVLTKETYKVELTKEEFTLVTKALVGKLRPEEASASKALGIALLDKVAERLEDKLKAIDHARDKAGTPENAR